MLILRGEYAFFVKVSLKTIFGQNRFFVVLRRARKINWIDLKIDLKKRSTKFRTFFENQPPPRENPRSAPDLIHMLIKQVIK